jgi:hypothetical protein
MGDYWGIVETPSNWRVFWNPKYKEVARIMTQRERNEKAIGLYDELMTEAEKRGFKVSFEKAEHEDGIIIEALLLKFYPRASGSERMEQRHNGIARCTPSDKTNGLYSVYIGRCIALCKALQKEIPAWLIGTDLVGEPAKTYKWIFNKAKYMKAKVKECGAEIDTEIENWLAYAIMMDKREQPIKPLSHLNWYDEVEAKDKKPLVPTIAKCGDPYCSVCGDKKK